MKLKEALKVLAYISYLEDAKGNVLYDQEGDFGRLCDYDIMVAKYGDCEVDEISAWHDCSITVTLRGISNET